MSNVPKLRFPEFEGEWEEETLDQLGSFKKGSVLGRQDLSSEGTPCILYGELYTKYREITTRVESRTEKDFSGLLRSEYGDILIPASGETADDISTSTCLLLSDVIIGGDINLYRSKKVDGRYLSYLLNHKKKNEIARLAQGASVVHIYSAQLKNIKILKPPAAEQTKIADFLTLIDKKITKQDEKITALEQYKKGLMQKIFSREIRFKDDNGKDYPAWAPTILNDILHERKTYADNNSGYQHVTLSTTGIYEKGVRYNRDFLVTAENKQYKITKLGDICYNPANLKFGVLCFNNYGDAIFSPIYVTFEVKQLVNANYIGYYLMRWDFINRVRKYEQGTVYERMAVGPADLLKHEFSLPSLPEQTKIANFLSLYDRKIEKEKEKLEALREQKKGLLQQMFV